MPPPRLMSCRLCGWAELRCRLRLCSPAPNQYRTFAQSAASSRRPVARRSSRQTFPSSSSSPSSQPSTSPPPGGREEHRESSSRTARQSTPVSVNSLAALRRAAFEPPSPSGQSDEDATLSPSQNTAVILDILAAHDRSLPLRQLERLIHTLLATGTANKIPPLTPQHYLTALRALTRRVLTLTRHLPHYTALAASTPLTASPYHPAHSDSQLMARLSSESDRRCMRRAFVLLVFGVRVDMAVQLLTLMQPDQSLPVQILQLAERVLELAGHRYMAARVRKAMMRAKDGDGLVTLPEVSELSADVRRAFPQLLASSGAVRAMTAAQTQRLAAELEQLSAGKLKEDEHLQLLLTSVRIGEELTADEVESLSDMLPLASQKLEMSRESEEDGILRWRVMELTAAITDHMQQQRTQFTPLIHDELFRIYAHCAAIQPALDLLASLRSTDTLHYRYLLRTASLLQRWEQPHIHAQQLLHSLPATTVPDVSMYNDVLRACDRAEQYELLFETVREMRQRGVEPNEVTHQYVTSAGVQCGDEGRGVVEVVGTDEASRAEWRREVEAEMEVVEQMEMKDFVPGLDDVDTMAEEGQKAEIMAEVQRVKEKLKAELVEEMKIVDVEPATPAAVASAQSTAKTERGMTTI